MNHKNTIHDLHFSVAETGKLHALKGDQKQALTHYREALRLAVSSKAPEVFFRHYTQCVLESLEMTEAYDEIIKFCQEADTYYQELELDNSFHNRDHGSILERLGMVQLKKGEHKAGHDSLMRARETAGVGVLSLTEEILGWLERSFSLDSCRLLNSQRLHNYFVVRPEQVDRKRAEQLAKIMSQLPLSPQIKNINLPNI